MSTGRGGLGRLLTSSGVSNLADGMYKTALPLLALQLTRSPVLVAGVAVAVNLPWLVCALPAGVLVDRVDRRRAMLVANAVRAALLVVLGGAALGGFAPIWALYAVALCVGTAEVVHDTSAQSVVPAVVDRAGLDRSGLDRANSALQGLELAANQFVGPALSGLLVAAGAVAAFTAPAALWLVAVVALWGLRGVFRAERAEPTSVRGDLLVGARFLVGNRLMLTMVLSAGAVNLALQAVWGVLPLFAVGERSVLHLTERGYGLLLAGTAVGGLVGAALAPRLVARVGARIALGTGLLVIPLTLFGALLIDAAFPAVVDGVPVGALALVVLLAAQNASAVVWSVVVMGLRHRVVPDALLGRVTAAHRVVSWGAVPLGAALGGVLGELLGLRPVFVVAGALLVVTAVLVLPRLRDAGQGALVG